MYIHDNRSKSTVFAVLHVRHTDHMHAYKNTYTYTYIYISVYRHTCILTHHTNTHTNTHKQTQTNICIYMTTGANRLYFGLNAFFPAYGSKLCSARWKHRNDMHTDSREYYGCGRAGMHVCMHVCMYVWGMYRNDVHTYSREHDDCGRAGMHVCMHICMYVCMHGVCMYRNNLHTWFDLVSVHAYIHTYVHTYIHTYTLMKEHAS